MTFGSLFSGIGGFDLGFERAGLECLWQCEIDPNARKVLARHWPHTPQFNDVNEIGSHNLPGVDIICGGFPCQDVSVAGKRAGLDGERSGLWFEFRRIVEELEPGIVIIENVPGLLSSNGGNDFAEILRGLAKLGYDVAWRVLDAQYDGLAQRRKRVFIIGCTRVGRAAKILFEPESLSWNTEPRREKGQRVAAPITRGSSSPGINPSGRRQEDDTNIVSATLTGSATYDRGDNLDMLIAGTLGAHKTGGWGNDLDNQGAFVVETPDIAWALQERDAKGSDSSTKDGHLLVIPIQEIGKRQSGNSTNGVGYGEDGDPMFTLQASAEHGVAISENQRGEVRETEYSRQLTTGGGKPGQGYGAVRTRLGVRRLTPTECARLQGFPDLWCDGLSDSAKYRALGNAIAEPVANWIGRRVRDNP